MDVYIALRKVLNYNALFVKCRCVGEFGFMDYNKKNILHVVNIYFVIPYCQVRH